uniref:Uncharacterized protein n=1 Tax=Rhizophora mucronata TaxID=61149 RepID=A0A2P2QJG1_RHIMU
MASHSYAVLGIETLSCFLDVFIS